MVGFRVSTGHCNACGIKKVGPSFYTWMVQKHSHPSNLSWCLDSLRKNSRVRLSRSPLICVILIKYFYIAQNFCSSPTYLYQFVRDKSILPYCCHQYVRDRFLFGGFRRGNSADFAQANRVKRHVSKFPFLPLFFLETNIQTRTNIIRPPPSCRSYLQSFRKSCKYVGTPCLVCNSCIPDEAYVGVCPCSKKNQDVFGRSSRDYLLHAL